MNVLAVGAHPDDIEYGCGGQLARLAEQGHTVWMFVGSRGERGGDPTLREAEQSLAAQILGVKQVGAGWPDTRVPDEAVLVEAIEGCIRALGADTVLGHTPEDSHQDHRAMALATVAAARRVPRVLCYHAPSSTRVFTRVLCADITDTIERKCQALDAHASQARHRLAELARAEATFWGGRAGVPYAEAFEPVRWLL